MKTLRHLLVICACAFAGCSSPNSPNSQYEDLLGNLAHPTTNWLAYIVGNQTNLVAVLANNPEDILGALPTTGIVTATAAPVTEWPALRCANFFIHGDPSENTIREKAFSDARAAGLDCIECDADFNMSDELGMHLLKLQHPDITGYYLRVLLARQRTDGWFFKGQRAGIVRWIHWLGTPNMAQAERWLFLVKDYTTDELQLKISSATAADVQQRLLNATNHVGVVVISPKSRKRITKGSAS